MSLIEQYDDATYLFVCKWRDKNPTSCNASSYGSECPRRGLVALGIPDRRGRRKIAVATGPGCGGVACRRGCCLLPTRIAALFPDLGARSAPTSRCRGFEAPRSLAGGCACCYTNVASRCGGFAGQFGGHMPCSWGVRRVHRQVPTAPGQNPGASLSVWAMCH